jgi:hypothetical protein
VGRGDGDRAAKGGKGKGSKGGKGKGSKRKGAKGRAGEGSKGTGKAAKPSKSPKPKQRCCDSRPRCRRCPIRMLQEGTLPEGYRVHRRRLVRL